MIRYTYSIPHPTDRCAPRVILHVTVRSEREWFRHVRGIHFKVISRVDFPTHPA